MPQGLRRAQAAVRYILMSALNRPPRTSGCRKAPIWGQRDPRKIAWPAASQGGHMAPFRSLRGSWDPKIIGCHFWSFQGAAK